MDEGDGRVGHHWDEYDTKGADVKDVDVSGDLIRARIERERKELMKKPKATDEFEYKVRLGGRLVLFPAVSIVFAGVLGVLLLVCRWRRALCRSPSHRGDRGVVVGA